MDWLAIVIQASLVSVLPDAANELALFVSAN